MIDVVLVATGSLLMLGARRQGRSTLLLTGRSRGLIVSHLLFLWSALHGGHGVAGPDTVAWGAFCVLLAGAALHPSMRLLSVPAERSGTGLTRARLAVFAVASLVAPSVTIAQAVLRKPRHVVISIASGVIFLLVLLRIADLVREHGSSPRPDLRDRFEARLGSLVRNSSDIVRIVDGDRVVLYISPAALRLVGLDEAGAEGMDWWEFVHPDDQPSLQWFLADLEQGASGDVEYRVRDARGSWIDVETLATNLVGDGAVEGIVLNTRDVSDRKALERRLLHQASHDTLTGLPNRTLLRDRVEQALARRRRSGAPLAVIFLDLDDFKNVNDTLGHAAGDAVLQEVARRLDSCIRGCDTATRLGGDEFAVLIDDLDRREPGDDGRRADPRVARPAAGRRRPRPSSRRAASASRSRSTGATRPTRCCATPTPRCTWPRTVGRAPTRSSSRPCTPPRSRACELKVELARAVADGEITLQYQPIVDLRSGEIRAYESLARWQHPERGPVAAGEFIPLAEETGLIVPLGRDLLSGLPPGRRVPRGVRRRDSAAGVGERVGARSSRPTASSTTSREAVEDAGIRPCDLMLELTESAIMSDVELAVARWPSCASSAWAWPSTTSARATRR